MLHEIGHPVASVEGGRIQCVGMEIVGIPVSVNAAIQSASQADTQTKFT